MQVVSEEPEIDNNGCVIERGFFISTNGENFLLMESLMDQGYEELYYSAPYHWGLLNPESRKIFTYTEGDTAVVICPNKEILVKEAEEYLDFIRKNHSSSPVVWAEGEVLVEKLKKIDRR